MKVDDGDEDDMSVGKEKPSMRPASSKHDPKIKDYFKSGSGKSKKGIKVSK